LRNRLSLCPRVRELIDVRKDEKEERGGRRLGNDVSKEEKGKVIRSLDTCVGGRKINDNVDLGNIIRRKKLWGLRKRTRGMSPANQGEKGKYQNFNPTNA